jgi:L-threonine kinase
MMERVMMAIGEARAPGTCGELVQGRFADGTDFLVTLPIDVWSTVQVTVVPDLPVTVHPASRAKTRQAVRLALDALGRPDMGARVSVESDLPVGKGMASSTADIVAACRATAAALGYSILPEMISHIARQIEPSDGVMYPGIVCYDHRRCRLIERLGHLPPLDILVVDLGGEVDTLAFNTLPKNYADAELAAIQNAYDLVVGGLRTGSAALIGRAATISARVNQRLLVKPHLEPLIQIAGAYGAYGVNVAHSGTVVGLLFGSGNRGAMQRVREAVLSVVDPSLKMWTVRTL